MFYKRGVASIELLDDLFAGSLVLMWSKLSPLIHGYRATANVHDYGLRFEYLAKALDERLTARGETHVPEGATDADRLIEELRERAAARAAHAT